jgi:hypothetical protein
MLTHRSINDLARLSKQAARAVNDALLPGEPLRVVVLGTFGSAFAATDRQVLIWKKGQLRGFPWSNVSNVAIGGGRVVRWIQLRGPSIGLVEPSLLNIGELVDTIQIGEPLKDDARAVVEMLVARYGLEQPLPAAAVPTSSGRVRADESAENSGPLLVASGAGGELALFADHLLIHHRGFRGFLRKALPAHKDIPLARITSVEWRSPGPFRLGRIGFRLEPAPLGPVDASLPEDQVMFYLHQEVAFREVMTEIERRLTGQGRPVYPD